VEDTIIFLSTLCR